MREAGPPNGAARDNDSTPGVSRARLGLPGTTVLWKVNHAARYREDKPVNNWNDRKSRALMNTSNLKNEPCLSA